METKTEFEALFTALDESAALLKDELNMTYLDALALAGDSIFQQKVMAEVNETTLHQLKKYISEINIDQFSKETVRKAIQLAVLKGMKEATQPHHVLTPDAICLFISYLVNKLVKKKSFSLLDPAIGSGNLVSAIMNQSESNITCYGFEVDETLIKLAYVNANLQRNEMELFHEDSIKPMHIPLVDLVVSDLPVGFYPKKEVAENYQLNEEKPLVHHLMIEQSINQAKEGAFLIFLIPNFLFETESAPKLRELIKEKVTIISLLQLPRSMFKNQIHGKSIFILQKNGENVKQPRQALLVELPSFSKKEALADIVARINKWLKDELNIN